MGYIVAALSIYSVIVSGMLYSFFLYGKKKRDENHELIAERDMKYFLFEDEINNI